MPLGVNDGVGGPQNFSYMTALAMLETLDQLKQLADQMLASQNKVSDKLIEGDRENERQLERLTKKLAEARVPQTMQQLTAMQTKIQEALPKFQQLGDTDTTTKLTAMLNNVDELKRQMAQRQALSSGPSAPPPGGGFIA